MKAREAPCLLAQVRATLGNFRLDMKMLLRRPGVVALYGPSGCGKTSFLRCLAGLEAAAEGRIQLGSHCWQNSSAGIFLPPHRRDVGMVFQDTRLFPHLRVDENLLFGARQRRLKPEPKHYDNILAMFDLEGLLRRRPATLSGGERQRVAIARSLLTHPRLLLLDEPLSAVDASRKSEILPYLERLFHEAKIPVIFVSHDWQDVLRLSSEVYIMERGRLRRHGPTMELQYQV
ncbi:MAG TPA: molybdenum ABC transporter ATP-binding protein, partial [Chromatiaceae bacterium]|nr:molybdenum ABC transporter ATP-binding protein [Chromatiaceae bacterium]